MKRKALPKYVCIVSSYSVDKFKSQLDKTYEEHCGSALPAWIKQ